MTPPALDIENFHALLDYLRDTGRIAPGETPRLVNLAGGVSNRTVLVERPTGEAWVLKQALAQLRVQVEWLSDPRRIEREALGMSRLADIAPAGTITRLVFLDPSVHLLAMEAVPQPHENWKNMLLAGKLNLDHVSQFAMLLRSIHDGADTRPSLEAEFDDRRFFESLRVEPYYLYTARQVPQAARFLNDLVDWTRAHRHGLAHGDYSPKNILVHHDRLILLDHEVIHYGDCAFDVGFALTHFLSKAHHLRELRNQFAQAAAHFWNVYRDANPSAAARDEASVVRHTLGCLLARCRGRSPLEYLDEPARTRQAEAVIELMRNPPETPGELIGKFL